MKKRGRHSGGAQTDMNEQHKRETGHSDGSAPEVCRPHATASLDEAQLLDTQRAFDSVAVDYDGPRGNNELIQRMRRILWDTVHGEFSNASRLLDLGCGTGIDAVEFARCGHHVVATDWSRQMVERTQARIVAESLRHRVTVTHLGIHQLDRLGDGFDGIYSNFGPMNCVPDLGAVAVECARLLRPGGRLIFSVMGRLCPWELGHYALRGRLKRAGVRAARSATAVGMNHHTIWTQYYFPREFYRAFTAHFSMLEYRALSLFVPPPFLVDYYRRHPRWYECLGWLDDRLGRLPLLRDMGDHFLIVMRRR